LSLITRVSLAVAALFASAGLLLPFASSASASTACTAPKGSSCEHAVRHAVHKAVRHAEHHARHHEGDHGDHHKRCHHHGHGDHEDDD
jgi:hypothetical protein